MLLRWLREFCTPRPTARRPAPRRLQVECLELRDCPSGGGLLDPTFGAGGIVLDDVGSARQVVKDVTVQSDGKIVAAGYVRGAAWYDFAVARYNPDGTRDLTFGSGGLTTTDLSNRAEDIAYAVAVQPGTGGKILVAGHAYAPNGTNFAVVRYNANGTIDTTFGDKASKGKVITDLGSNDFGRDMAVLPDGKFILAGVTLNLGSSGAGSLSLARYNANGTLDTSFGARGKVVTTIAVERFGGLSVAVDGGGRLVVAANTPESGPSKDFLLARFNANGSLDTAFGAGGVVRTDVASGSYDRAYALTIQGDGKMVVVGHASPPTSPEAPAAVVRYNSNGTLDTSFGQGGVALIDALPDRNSGSVARAVVVQPDGKLLLAGEVSDPQDYNGSANMVVSARLNADGTPDTSYGPAGTGMVITSIGYNAVISAMDVQADGRAVVVGAMNTGDGSNYIERFALLRFLGASASPSAVQIGSFTASAATVSSGSPLTLTAGSITTTNTGATVTKVAFYTVDSNGVEQLIGYGTANLDGTWTLTFTANLAPGSYTLLALAVDSEGDISDPFALNLDVL